MKEVVAFCVHAGIGMTANGTEALAYALQPRQDRNGAWLFNPSISALTLSYNFIQDAGAKALAEALQPRWQTSDGKWVFPTALKTMDLTGTPPSMAQQHNPGVYSMLKSDTRESVRPHYAVCLERLICLEGCRLRHRR